MTIPASVTKLGYSVFDGSGVVSLDLSHVMEFDEFGTCKNLKKLKLNAKLKGQFPREIYQYMTTCPHMTIKYENGKFVYPVGLVFVETK